MENTKNQYTVKLDTEKCKGCIACMKKCPTDAIRVRNGKAEVFYDKCIACGECVRICKNRAKNPVYDSISIINDYKYKIALPAPSLFGQFNNLEDVNIVLAALKKIGFDDIGEVAVAAEIITDATRQSMSELLKRKPIISTACPAVVELILLKFHNLRNNLLDFIAPVDLAAKMIKQKVMKEKGLSAKDIGVFFISPCPAKVYALKSGLGVVEPYVDGVLSISEVYFKLLPEMKDIQNPEPLSKMGIRGMLWASSGGEALGVVREKYIAADGIENVISILSELEDGTLKDVDFIELSACVGGCVGGVMNIENPYIAKAKLRSLRKYLGSETNTLVSAGITIDDIVWENPPKTSDCFKLDDDRIIAMQKMFEINKVYEKLPHIDCGVCGAPTCIAFAEDVVNGKIDISYCIRSKENIVKTDEKPR